MLSFKPSYFHFGKNLLTGKYRSGTMGDIFTTAFIVYPRPILAEAVRRNIELN